MPSFGHAATEGATTRHAGATCLFAPSQTLSTKRTLPTLDPSTWKRFLLLCPSESTWYALRAAWAWLTRLRCQEQHQGLANKV